MTRGYIKTTFGKVATLQQGLAFNKKTNHLMAKNGIPLLRIVNLKNGTSDKFVNEREVNPKFISTKEDIIFTRTGQVGLVFRGRHGIVHNNCFRVIPYENISRGYMYWYLRQDIIRRKANALAGGSAQPDLNHNAFKSIGFIYPEDLQTQESVANTLQNYEDLVENNSKRIEKLESMARLLYRHYFEVPESDGWEELPLSEALVVHRGKSYKSSELSESGGLPFVNLKCINRGGGFRKDGLKLFTGSFKEEQLVEKGDLVMAVTDMTQERMIIARAARVPSLDGGYGVISMDMVKLEPKEGFVKDYLYAMLRWSRFADEVKNHANGANVLHLIPARITDFSLPMPPQELQQEFSENISPLLNLIDNLQLKNEALVKARDLLLPRLMSGEIEV